MRLKNILLLGLFIMCLFGCNGLQYALPVVGFTVNEIRSNQRQNEIQEKLNGYDVQLGRIEKKIDLTYLKNGGDTLALAKINGDSIAAANPFQPEQPKENPFNSDALMLLLSAVVGGSAGGSAPLIKKALAALAKSKGIDENTITEIEKTIEGVTGKNA